jgi:iron(III) transport system ATP-binding protein
MIYPSLEARHVSRTFGALTAVNDVSLVLEQGQVLALLGRSGSGKSTLLRILAGLEGIDDGQVLSKGEVVATRSVALPPEKRGLGMVFQDYALFPHLTALGNVAFGLHAMGKQRAQDLAADWLDKIGLMERANYFPHQLSGGEQQRIALARALAPSPSAILMDEPFSGLDPFLRADLQRTMVSTLRAAGIAALVVSHDTEEALAIADHVAIMDYGRVIQSGKPNEVYDAPLSLDAARALGPIWSMAATGDNGAVVTPFGTFPTTLLGNVIVAARPETTSLIPSPDGAFIVSDIRGVGRFATATLQGHAGVIQARIEANQGLELGASAHVRVAIPNAFVFST